VPQFSIRFLKTDVPTWAKKYSYGEDERVLEIGVRSRSAGYYKRDDFLEVCEWKTRGRPRRHYQRNSEQDVRRVTAIALSSADEKTRITSLIGAHGGLRGVSWPTASVLLHLAHKDPYPILDFRALWSLQVERSYYTFNFWQDYVQACRALAVECDVSMRDLDRALWEYSNKNQRKEKCVSRKGSFTTRAPTTAIEQKRFAVDR
jgi:hypothetical protein